jgi:hypothetical protein
VLHFDVHGVGTEVGVTGAAPGVVDLKADHGAQDFAVHVLEVHAHALQGLEVVLGVAGLVGVLETNVVGPLEGVLELPGELHLLSGDEAGGQHEAGHQSQGKNAFHCPFLPSFGLDDHCQTPSRLRRLRIVTIAFGPGRQGETRRFFDECKKIFTVQKVVPA